jgi:hypothetical protein
MQDVYRTLMGKKVSPEIR